MIRLPLIVYSLCVMLMQLGCTKPEPKVQRFGQVVAIRSDGIEGFVKTHSMIWPKAMAGPQKSNIKNYSIYSKELEAGKHYLFRYFEYTGSDLQSDFKKMPENSDVLEWLNLDGNSRTTNQLSEPNVSSWANMEEVFYFEGKGDAGVDESKVQSHGTVIGIRPEMIDPYKLLHKYTWPEVLNKIREGNLRNYSIYLHELDGKYYLFTYFEYVGDNFDSDMAMIGNDSATIAWMKFTDKGCQLPISTRAEGEWWAAMDQVFRAVE